MAGLAILVPALLVGKIVIGQPLGTNLKFLFRVFVFDKPIKDLGRLDLFDFVALIHEQHCIRAIAPVHVWLQVVQLLVRSVHKPAIAAVIHSVCFKLKYRGVGVRAKVRIVSDFDVRY